jgi:TolB-like protein/Tfp pilus assembly protein PilF
MVGTTLGHFQNERKLGAGGMGEANRARDTRLGRDVALKLLPQTTPEKLARFEREARAVAGLAHPNIVVLHAIEQHEGQHFLVLELVEGQDLAEVVAPGGLALPRVLELAIPLADALASAHERGVIHRDLKPANVKLARDGRVKVLDFGLARMLEGDLEQTVAAPLSEAGQALGTVPYMAPEQLRGEAVDARADLFALGVIVYELATGRRPFEGKSLVDVSSAILRDAPAPAEMPAELARIVARCLAKDVRERWPSAQEVANELRRIAVGRSAAAPRPGNEVSTAVLPFANRSANPDDEYFAEGLADELLGVLARIRGLRVAGRTSAARFKNTTETVASIGQQLNVETLLEGTVRKSGNRVRIGVQLVRVPDGGTVWSETYDRTLDDVFAVQDDIAHSVVKELRKALLGEADDSDASREAKAEVAIAAARGRSTNPEAQRLFLQARYIGQRRTVEDMAHALEILDRAIALDPAFALAWEEKSRVHYYHITLGYDLTPERNRKAHEAIDRALELEPGLASAHAHLGWIHLSELDLKVAAECARRARELDPDNPLVLRFQANMAITFGHLSEAIAWIERAIAIDPLTAVYYSIFAIVRIGLGEYDEAVAAIRRAIELSPRSPTFHSTLARALLGAGRLEEAVIAAEAETLEVHRLWTRSLTLEAAGRRAEADRLLNELIERFPADFAIQIAMLFAARGDIEPAFEWFERAKASRDTGLSDVMVLPELRPLHGDPRWHELLRWIGIEE